MQAPHPEHFLIVSTTGLGDTLWGTPAIRALRSRYPQGYIAVLTSPIGREVLQNNPHIDELFTCGNNFFALLRHWWTLRRRKIKTALIFHTSQRATLPFCHWIGAEQIIGTSGMSKGGDALLTTALPPQKMHEIARRLYIVMSAGVTETDPQLEISCTPEESAQIETLLASLPRPWIALHPGAKDRFKQWPAENFIALGQRLQSHLGATVLITGTLKEKKLTASIAAAIVGSIAIADKLSVGALAALLQRMQLIISNDTGPMHVALAMKAPLIALFGPTDPSLCGPYLASRAHVIAKRPTCTPCLRKQCREPFCLLQIGIDEVYNAALGLFYAT